MIKLLFGIIGLPVFLFAQSFQIAGHLTDPSGNALAGAMVYIHETRMGTYSDSVGHFKLSSLKEGNYHLHVSAVGYASMTRTLVINQSISDLHLILFPSELNLEEIIIESESDRREKKHSSQTFEVINRKFMELYGTGNLMTSLERLPGISAIRTGVGISKPVIRGSSFNRVMVVENGIKQEGQQWGADHGLELDPYTADRVEILRGPSSLLYGSEAMGGVINIRQAPFPLLNHWEGSLHLSGRTLNQALAGSAMVGFNYKGWIIRTRMTRQAYGDYQVPADSFIYNRYHLPLLNQRLKNTAGTEESFSTTIGRNATWGHAQLYYSRVDQQAGFFPGAFGIPRSQSLQSDDNLRNIGLPKQSILHQKIIGNATILLGKQWIEMDMGIQQNLRKELSNPHAAPGYPIPQGTTALSLDLFTYSLNARFHWLQTQRWKAIIGTSGSYQQNRSGGYEHLIPAYRNGQAGVFIFEQYQVKENITFNAGARYDGGTTQFPAYASPMYSRTGVFTGMLERNRASERLYASVSGAGGIAWQPSAPWDIKVNLSSDFRFPSPAELSTNGIHHGTFRHVVGDAYLKPERGYQADLHIGYELKKMAFVISPFYQYFTQYIFLSPSGRFSYLPEGGQIYQYLQAPARLTGGEFSGKFQLTSSLEFQSTYEYVWAENLFTHLPLPFIPPGSFSQEISGNWDLKNKRINHLMGSITWQVFNSQKRVDRNELITPGYSLWNFSGGIHFKFGKQLFRFLVQVQNIGDRWYLHHLSRYRILQIPEPGRNIIFSLIIPFSGAFGGEHPHHELQTP